MTSYSASSKSPPDAVNDEPIFCFTSLHLARPADVEALLQQLAASRSAYGEHVVIETDDVRHGYCHLSKIFVKVAQAVTAGQRIAASGNTGNTTGAHLHYEERTRPFKYAAKDRRPQFSRWPPYRKDSSGRRSVRVQVALRPTRLRLGEEAAGGAQRHLTVGGRTLKVTGDCDELTRDEVKRWQEQVAKDPPQFCDGNLGPLQAHRLFARTGNTVRDDT
jgi:hypothetical protein